MPALWWALAVMAIVAAIATHWILPPSQHHATQSETTTHVSNRELLRDPQTWALAIVSFGMLFALDNIFILYGAVLEDRFDLTLGALGILSVVISVAELLAELVSAGLTDKIGKKRSSVGGLVLFAAAVMLIPFISTTAFFTVLGFALAIFVFEYTVVSFVPFVSEINPAARATLLGLYIGAFGVGRIVSPLVSTRLYTSTGSLLLSCALSAIAALIAAFILWRGIKGDE